MFIFIEESGLHPAWFAFLGLEIVLLVGFSVYFGLRDREANRKREREERSEKRSHASD